MISKITTPLYEFIEKLSKIQRIALCSGLLVLVGGGFGWLSIYPKFSDIQRLKTEVEDLERRLTIAKRKAGQRARYRKMLENAKADFNVARKALPEKKEIPSLLTGISQAGKTAGLEFFLFDPRSEKEQDFYAEIPVDIKVKGSYHNVAEFFDKVSRLFRVVNITDIVITKGKQGSGLDTSCRAITYRFLEKAAEEKSKTKKGK
jgi:type IV pilus assembly protein PilO